MLNEYTTRNRPLLSLHGGEDPPDEAGLVCMSGIPPEPHETRTNAL
jgi:hypothetical protein